MKAMTAVLVLTIILFAAEWAGAFIQPMNTPGTPAGQGNTQYTASQGAEIDLISVPNSPQESIPTIPEPSTALLVGLGLVGTGITRVRKPRR